jgi:S-DNA-T family DNA segregation ATPase FtsK/SpoIIIE
MVKGRGCGALVGVGCVLYERPVTHPHQGTAVGVWLLAALAVFVAVVGALSPWLRRRVPRVWWPLWGYPVAAVRVRRTWRRLTDLQDLSVAKRPALGLVGNVLVRGRALRTVPPRIGAARFRRGGLVVRVRLHPGQTPDMYLASAEAMAHAWRVFAVRITSDERGFVVLTATAWDPLAAPVVPRTLGAAELLTAVVGQWEDGAGWLVNLRMVPHWLIVGATRSGKSTLMAALVTAWAPQRLALVGIDLKGGMELALFEARLSALATTRAQAAELLSRLVEITVDRMALCRTHGARSIWDLPDKLRPIPVIVLVDELAELYLMASSADKAEVGQISTSMVRLGQLGAALGVHLIIAGQRVGSELGTGVTALRAQLLGRICHRVADKGTAEMALGDLAKDALAVAQQITADEQGVAVTFGLGGGWMRARSIHVTPDQAQRIAEKYAHLAVPLGQLGWTPQDRKEVDGS